MIDAIVVCRINATASYDCVKDCRKCKYGGTISIGWTEYSFAYGEVGQEYIQYFQDKDDVVREYLITDKLYRSYPSNFAYVANNTLLKKLNALITWLNEHYTAWAENLTSEKKAEMLGDV